MIFKTSKPTFIQLLTYFPPHIRRKDVLYILRNPEILMRLQPQIVERAAIKTPQWSPRSEQSAQWYLIRDQISYLSGLSKKVDYIASFSPRSDGLKTHVYAAMGLEFKCTYTLGGDGLEEVYQDHGREGLTEDAVGLWLEEIVELKAPKVIGRFIKWNMKSVHNKLIENITNYALHRSLQYWEGSTPDPIKAISDLIRPSKKKKEEEAEKEKEVVPPKKSSLLLRRLQKKGAENEKPNPLTLTIQTADQKSPDTPTHYTFTATPVEIPEPKSEEEEEEEERQRQEKKNKPKTPLLSRTPIAFQAFIRKVAPIPRKKKKEEEPAPAEVAESDTSGDDLDSDSEPDEEPEELGPKPRYFFALQPDGSCRRYEYHHPDDLQDIRKLKAVTADISMLPNALALQQMRLAQLKRSSRPKRSALKAEKILEKRGQGPRQNEDPARSRRIRTHGQLEKRSRSRPRARPDLAMQDPPKKKRGPPPVVYRPPSPPPCRRRKKNGKSEWKIIYYANGPSKYANSAADRWN